MDTPNERLLSRVARFFLGHTVGESKRIETRCRTASGLIDARNKEFAKVKKEQAAVFSRIRSKSARQKQLMLSVLVHPHAQKN